MSQRFIDYIKYDATITLIVINVAVFILLKVCGFIAVITGAYNFQWITEFALPSDFVEFLHKPWSLVLYMFAQTDAMHLIFNMLWLFCFGKLIHMVASYRNILLLYVCGGLFGGLVFVGLYKPITHIDSWLMGASASVITLATAVAVIMPNYKIQFLAAKIKVLWLVIAVVALIAVTSSLSNIGGGIAHIGGIVVGIIYGLIFRRSQNRISNVERVANELNILLNKVKQNGYSSLTRHEQRRLFELSAKRNLK